MKMSRVIAIAVAAIFIVACMPGASADGTRSGPEAGNAIYLSDTVIINPPSITKEQAEKNIRDFMGSQDPGLVYDLTMSPEYGRYYVFYSTYSYFVVNRETGIIETAGFLNNTPLTSDRKISQDEALAKAKEYARSKCHGFIEKNWKLVVDRWVPLSNGTYAFMFQEEKEQVLLPSIVLLQINPGTGAIVLYHNSDSTNASVSLRPVITLDTAAGNAERWLKEKSCTIDSSNGHLAIFTDTSSYHNQRLAWVVMAIDHGENAQLPREIYVDATDGAVIEETFSWPQMWIDTLNGM